MDIIFNSGLLYTQQGTCGFDKKQVGAMMSGSVSIQEGSERDLQAAVATAGPVAVAVDARNKAFRVYMSGELCGVNCFL